MVEILTSQEIVKILILAFIAITFTQSAIDKIIDWSGNLSFLTGHFKNSPLARMVPMLLGIVTITELMAGILTGLGAILLLLGQYSQLGLFGLEFAALSLLMLLFGQRLAKDYAGAAGLVPYFLLSVAGIYLFTF